MMSTQVQTSIERSAGATPAQPTGNVIGRMTGLTLFTPVRRRWEPVLRSGFWLGKYVPLAQISPWMIKAIVAFRYSDDC